MKYDNRPATPLAMFFAGVLIGFLAGLIVLQKLACA